MTFPFVLSAASDVAVAAHRRLSAVPGVIAVLGSSGAAPSVGVWLFVRELQALVEGSGQAAAVLREEGAWARPNRHNTARFPRLLVEIFADSSRDLSGSISRRDAEPRARVVWEAFQSVLHRVDGFAEVWGHTISDPGLRVWGAQLLEAPAVDPVPDWDGGVRLRSYYGLSSG